MATRRRRVVVLGLLGTTLDAAFGKGRWNRWRPTVCLAQQEDLIVDRLELLHGRGATDLAKVVTEDIAQVSPETTVRPHLVEFTNPWDFEHVYEVLHDFALKYPFDLDHEEYLVHITTGTHVAQICLFLLAESRYFPARLIQTSPSKHTAEERISRRSRPASEQSGGAHGRREGTYTIIDLDLSKYDRLASRFTSEKVFAQSFLKSGIETKNAHFNTLIERIERVAVSSRAPILLTGPTGAGKSRLAKRIFELKKAKRLVTAEFAEVNCATLRGDAAMSALFGHKKGAFTGAVADRAGLLRKAHEGVLFLDEVGELGQDEQAMLLRAIEEKSFYPMGSDREVSSDFQLLCGTNRDLPEQIRRGTFREDLYARINLWTFELPALRDRPEDMAPNLDFELAQISRRLGLHLTMSKEARASFLKFAHTWSWPGNFRDFDAAMTRMATLAEGGRITERVVQDEVARLTQGGPAPIEGEAGFSSGSRVAAVLGSMRAERLDRFDRVQLEDVLSVCASSKTLSEAGRKLFARSREAKASANDADRIRKYLARFDIAWVDIARARPF
ncbi:MAG: RNA repair transcriptional activator RtcR [Polyangiaceae bacterium]